MSEDDEESKDKEELEWDECCVCGHHWTGILGTDNYADFHRCSECGELCCGNCWDEELEMCEKCATKAKEEESE